MIRSQPVFLWHCGRPLTNGHWPLAVNMNISQSLIAPSSADIDLRNIEMLLRQKPLENDSANSKNCIYSCNFPALCKLDDCRNQG